MTKLSLRSSSLPLLLLAASTSMLAAAARPTTQPTALEADSLIEPLGIDNLHPGLSWRLQDARPGARQTAYEIAVFTHRPAATPGAKPDVWESGRIRSATSTGIPYAGPDLQPERRHFWRVTAWDQNDQPYPVSATSWFETGLLQQTNWHTEWIGYEPEELHSIRQSGATWITNVVSGDPQPNDTQHDFRTHLSIEKPVQRVVLYTTGEDTAAAWINGQQVLQAKPLVPWNEMPWSTYERVDVTASVQKGENLLAIGITRYKTPRAARVATQAPMSAVLFVAFTDGSTRLFTTAGEGWMAQLNATDGWWQTSYNNGSWKAAECYKPAVSPQSSSPPKSRSSSRNTSSRSASTASSPRRRSPSPDPVSTSSTSART